MSSTYIAVPILNWNGFEDTVECVSSILNSYLPEGVHLTLIVLDNCSADDSYMKLRNYLQKYLSSHDTFHNKVSYSYKLTECTRLDFENLVKCELGSEVYLVQNGSNLGFAGGINVGFRYAINNGCNYVLLVNNDAVIRPDSLKHALETIESNSQIGAVAAKIIIAGTSLIDTAGDGCTFAGKFYKRYQYTESSSVVRQERVFGFCGGGALIRTSLLEMVGLFDEDFFINHEDGDLSYRSQLRGWEIILNPEFVIEHKVSQAMLKVGKLPVYYSLLNSDRVYFKNTPLILILQTLPERLLFSFISFVYWCLVMRVPGTYLQAKLFFWGSFSVTLEKRQKVMHSRKLKVQDLRTKLDSSFGPSLVRSKLRTLGRKSN